MNYLSERLSTDLCQSRASLLKPGVKVMEDDAPTTEPEEGDEEQIYILSVSSNGSMPCNLVRMHALVISLPTFSILKRIETPVTQLTIQAPTRSPGYLSVSSNGSRPL